jgi:hypothetical protein
MGLHRLGETVPLKMLDPFKMIFEVRHTSVTHPSPAVQIAQEKQLDVAV